MNAIKFSLEWSELINDDFMNDDDHTYESFVNIDRYNYYDDGNNDFFFDLSMRF